MHCERKSRVIDPCAHIFAFPSGGIGKYIHHLLIELSRYSDIEMEFLAQPDYLWREPAGYFVQPDLFRISDARPIVRKLRFLIEEIANPRRLVVRARRLRPQVIHLANVNQLYLPLQGRDLQRRVARCDDFSRREAACCYHLTRLQKLTAPQLVSVVRCFVCTQSRTA